jgi:hypothetical protein
MISAISGAVMGSQAGFSCQDGFEMDQRFGSFGAGVTAAPSRLGPQQLKSPQRTVVTVGAQQVNIIAPPLGSGDRSARRP